MAGLTIMPDIAKTAGYLGRTVAGDLPFNFLILTHTHPVNKMSDMEKDNQQSNASGIENFFKSLSCGQSIATPVQDSTALVIEEYLKKLVLGFDKKSTSTHTFSIPAQILSTGTNAHRVQESRLEQVPTLVAARIFAMLEEDSDQVRLALTSKKMGSFCMGLLRQPSSILLVPFHATNEELNRPLIIDAVEWLEPKMRYCHRCGTFRHLDEKFWESFHGYVEEFLRKTQFLQKPKAKDIESRARFIMREWNQPNYETTEEFDYFDHHWFSKSARDYIKWSLFGSEGYDEDDEDDEDDDDIKDVKGPDWKCHNTTMAEFASETFEGFICPIHYYGEQLLRWISLNPSLVRSNMYFFGTMKVGNSSIDEEAAQSTTKVSLSTFNRFWKRAPESVDGWWKKRKVEGVTQTKKMLIAKEDDSDYDPDEDDSDRDSDDSHNSADTSDNSVTTDLSEWDRLDMEEGCCYPGCSCTSYRRSKAYYLPGKKPW